MFAHPRLRSVAVLITGAALLAACSQSVTGTPRATAPSSTPASAGTSSTPSNSPATYPPVTEPLAQFRDCSSVLTESGVSVEASLKGKLTVGCATISVPLNYTDPTGSKISLTLVKVHDSDNTHSTGSLLVNPGGPGGSGVNLAIGLLTNFPASVLQHFDLVGFDPRGVGFSTPIDCASNSEKDKLNAASPDMSTTAGFAQAKALALEFDQGCVKNQGARLPFFNTVNTARDMDLIRQAVGDPQMNYLGFSYGTELGSVYAHLFPSKIRVAVLDGAVDPLTSGITQFADQLEGFELAFDQFATNCLTLTACKPLGDPRRVAEQIEAKALAQPLKTSSASRPLTASLASTGILQALYSKSSWPALASALIAGEAGNGTPLLNLADEYIERASDGTYSNIADANTAISCNDTAPGPTDATIHATAAKWATEYPLFGTWASASLFSCQQWQPIRLVPPKPTAPTSTKVLVIGNLHDPATPYQGAKDLTTTMGNAELLSWDGEGHTSYLEGSSCVDNYVNNYLINQTLPPVDTTCPK